MIPIITIDGPSGAGKGTITQKIAHHLHWNILDSGALYRILALLAERKGFNCSHRLLPTDQLVEIASTFTIHFNFNQKENKEEIVVDDENVSLLIRNERIGDFASRIAKLAPVRKALLHYQQAFAKSPGLVADGRDMGSVVFSKAPIKIFLTASSECRAKRRYQQLTSLNKDVNFLQILKTIQERDQRDQNRNVAPLIAAKDAFLIDSSDLSIEAVYLQSMDYIFKKKPHWNKVSMK
jgi:cytidylate kinase